MIVNPVPGSERDDRCRFGERAHDSERRLAILRLVGKALAEVEANSDEVGRQTTQDGVVQGLQPPMVREP